MAESFTEMLAVGGKANSLDRVNDVIEIVLNDESRLEELYNCLFEQDAWIRMRAADAIEKVCRIHPEWIQSYVDRLQDKLSECTQASIQWHLAQIYRQVELSAEQRAKALAWLQKLISDTDVDWIVAANVMDTLVQFSSQGYIPKERIISLIQIQQKHKSKSVVRCANKLFSELSVES